MSPATLLVLSLSRTWDRPGLPRLPGALGYTECAGEDLGEDCGLSFPKMANCRRGDRVYFSWILYRSRAHRDRVMAAVMEDPRLAKMMDPAKPPFDMERTAHGGFTTVVDLAAPHAGKAAKRRAR